MCVKDETFGYTSLILGPMQFTYNIRIEYEFIPF